MRCSKMHPQMAVSIGMRCCKGFIVWVNHLLKDGATKAWLGSSLSQMSAPASSMRCRMEPH